MDIKTKAREGAKEYAAKEYPVSTVFDEEWRNESFKQTCQNDIHRHYLAGYLQAHSDIMAELGEVEEGLQFYKDWYCRTRNNNRKLKEQGDSGTFGHVQHDVDVTLVKALTKLRELRGDQDAKD